MPSTTALNLILVERGSILMTLLRKSASTGLQNLWFCLPLSQILSRESCHKESYPILHDWEWLSNLHIRLWNYGSESYTGRARFNPHDLVEEISEKTGLCYTSVLKIIAGISNKDQYIKNPPVFMEQAVFKIRQVQLDELVRCIEYTPTGNIYEFKFEDFSKDGCEDWIATPNHGVWDNFVFFDWGFVICLDAKRFKMLDRTFYASNFMRCQRESQTQCFHADSCNSALRRRAECQSWHYWECDNWRW